MRRQIEAARAKRAMRNGRPQHLTPADAEDAPPPTSTEVELVRPITQDQLDEIYRLTKIRKKLSHHSVHLFIGMLTTKAGEVAHTNIYRQYPFIHHIYQHFRRSLTVTPSHDRRPLPEMASYSASLLLTRPLTDRLVKKLEHYPQLLGNFFLPPMDQLEKMESEDADQLIIKIRALIFYEKKIAKAMIYITHSTVIFYSLYLFYCEIERGDDLNILSFFQMIMFFATLAGNVSHHLRFDPSFNIDLNKENDITQTRLDLNIMTKDLDQDSWRIVKNQTGSLISYSLCAKKTNGISGGVVAQLIESVFIKYGISITRKMKELTFCDSLSLSQDQMRQVNQDILESTEQFGLAENLKIQLIQFAKRLDMYFTFTQSLRGHTLQMTSRAVLDDGILVPELKDQLTRVFGKNISFRASSLIINLIHPVSDKELSIIQLPPRNTTVRPTTESKETKASSSVSFSTATIVRRAKIEEEKQPPQKKPPLSPSLQSKPPIIGKWGRLIYDSRRKESESDIVPLSGATVEDVYYVYKGAKIEDLKDSSDAIDGIMKKRFQEQINYPKVASETENQGFSFKYWGIFKDKDGIEFDCQVKIKILGPSRGNARIFCDMRRSDDDQKLLIIPKVIDTDSHRPSKKKVSLKGTF